jgi:hypothetical protein
MISETLNELLVDALCRKRQKCFHKTVYSHDTIKQWLESAIHSSTIHWDVIIPIFKSKNDNRRALSLWPNKRTSNAVQQWLKCSNCKDPKDLIDGACEPLALYLSISIINSIKDETFKDVMSSNNSTKKTLEKMTPSLAAKTIFENFLNADTTTPLLWGPNIQGAYGDYLFGSDEMKEKVNKEILLHSSPSSISCMPMYVLNYLYDTEELNPADLLASTEESAQYSLHAVGLVFDGIHNRIIVADPNGALIPGSNMEFVHIPLLRRSSASTNLSTFDMDIDMCTIVNKKRKF